MDFSQYGITAEIIGRWLILGIATGYLLTRFQKSFFHEYLPLQAAFLLAVVISTLLLFLLLLGFIGTIIAILSFGSGILFFLIAISLRNLLVFLLLGKPRIHRNL